MIVNFRHCSREVTQEMIDAFYDKHVPLPEGPELNGKWSPAEVNQILFRNFGDPEKSVEELVGLSRADLYGFDTENVTLETTVEALTE